MKKYSFVVLIMLVLAMMLPTLPGYCEEIAPGAAVGETADGAPDASAEMKAGGELFGEGKWIESRTDGYIAAVFEGGAWRRSSAIFEDGGSGKIQIQVKHEPSFHEDPAMAGDWLEKSMDAWGMGGDELLFREQEQVDISGHPAGLLRMRCRTRFTKIEYDYGLILYPRNNTVLQAQIAITDGASRLQMADLEELASHIDYDSSEASLTQADGEISLSTKDDVHVLTAGKKLQIKAEFANPERVNLLFRNDDIDWTAIDPETGKPDDYVKVDDKGVVTVQNKLSEAKKIEVTASSPVFYTHSSYELTVLPTVKNISLEPKTLTLYEGSPAEETVRVALTPDTVPPIGMEWTVRKDDVIELVPGEDGTATVKPLAEGKTTVSVQEPGGKKATMIVSVEPPVERIELSALGKAVPGGVVTVKASLLPKKVAIRKLDWSLDVDESVATCLNGIVKIKKDAPVGMVITVTCVSDDAPAPVSESMQIEIIAK